MRRPVVAVLLACAASGACAAEPTPDIARVADVRSQFGATYQVTTIDRTGIDPARVGSSPLPPGLTFAPPECAELATGEGLPNGVAGNMAAVSAAGEGNRYFVIAVETSADVPAPEAPGENCRRVDFTGPQLHGAIEVVDAPAIDGVTTSGTHRGEIRVVNGRPVRGELYNYVARFDNYQVIVTADPLLTPGQPVAPVNTDKARALLTAAVSAVRG
ncbi:DUF5642 family protein [Mycobacterium sp. MYCO198283]|uniref:DUF5642 family protein n=1 Tax=Mycobacterium sp. MYCO198283 TaxID=2883505 RepID=UPI001E64D4BD|nr:DUF5642 family protein [Mycobacterium sp. MYCO198283]MCG5430958.1 DUF5642 family protein [Mycobacterium sp. MYCO198283]